MVNEDMRSKSKLKATFIHHVRSLSGANSGSKFPEDCGKELKTKQKSVSLHVTHVGMAIKVCS